MPRIALGIRYNGLPYEGWQSQLSGNTVQDHLQAALSSFVCAPIRVHCAGRTDAGVHGWMQVVHFNTTVQRTENAWVRGSNAFLPKDIAVQWALPVPQTFHARACAINRRYRYIVLNTTVRPSLEHGRVGWVFRPLSLQPMCAAAAYLKGEHDFSAFRAAACQAPSAIKVLETIQISQQESYWLFDFQANAFLHHMIRNIMGCLIDVGLGKHPPEWVAEVLASKQRALAAPTFAAEGLYFVGPSYAKHWGIPEARLQPLSLP